MLHLNFCTLTNSQNLTVAGHSNPDVSNPRFNPGFFPFRHFNHQWALQNLWLKTNVTWTFRSKVDLDFLFEITDSNATLEMFWSKVLPRPVIVMVVEPFSLIRTKGKKWPEIPSKLTFYFDNCFIIIETEKICIWVAQW